MKLYTGKGDTGFSCLADGKKLKKSEVVFSILGGVDELSCFLGLAKCKCSDKELFGDIETVQKDLQRLMAHIASKNDEKYALGDEYTKFLENRTNFYYSKAQSKNGFEFVLPGGCELSAILNLARCAARKAERFMCKDGEGYEKSACDMKYVNRLSDFLYAAALFCDKNLTDNRR